MQSLWKRIVHEGVSGCEYSSPDLVSHIIRAPSIVDARMTEDIVGGPVVWRDKTGMALPFPLFWYEYEEYEESARVGILVGTVSRPNFPNPAEMVPLMRAGIQYVRCSIVFSRSGLSPRLIADVTMGMTPDGSLVLAESDSLPVGLTYKHPSLDADTAIFTPLANLCECLVLLSCKNVELSPRDTDPKQARIATKRHGPTPHGYRYHVLVVRPAGSRPGAPGFEIGNMPRHVCRGHFAEYGPKYGKGMLFGKYEGRFFIPPHVKGNAKNGVVEKDYEVRA